MLIAGTGYLPPEPTLVAMASPRAVDREMHGHRHHDRYRHAVEQRGAIDPLAHGVDGRGLEERVAAQDLDVDHAALVADRAVQDHVALHPGGPGDLGYTGTTWRTFRGGWMSPPVRIGAVLAEGGGPPGPLPFGSPPGTPPGRQPRQGRRATAPRDTTRSENIRMSGLPCWIRHRLAAGGSRVEPVSTPEGGPVRGPGVARRVRP